MMKRFLITIITAISVNTALMAQVVIDGITIFDGDIKRNGQMVTVNMDMDLSKFDLSANEAVLLTPVIKKDTLSQALPPLGFYGRNRYYYYTRNNKSMAPKAEETIYRENEIPENLPYITNVPFEE
jgi:hypothetical protein